MFPFDDVIMLSPVGAKYMHMSLPFRDLINQNMAALNFGQVLFYEETHIAKYSKFYNFEKYAYMKNINSVVAHGTA